ncbi:MAG: TonB-dependent receptor [Mesorhizobium sp.]|nr:TonB-dependent receptor [Mesorhizobium sp.]
MARFSGNILALAALPALAFGGAAHAQDIDVGEIVVTPNRTPTDKTKTGSKVEVVTKKEIEEKAKPYILDYLTLVPGVHVASPGGAGQESSVSVRGADKKYIKTLFNGIDISDPTSTQVQTSYQNLLAGGIAKIEVLKGSQSTLYGSDAVAGVIGITTLGDVAPGLHHDILLEGGSFGTVRGGYSLSGASDTGKAAFGLYGVRTDGISAADSRFGNFERDDYANLTATFAGEQRLNDNLSVFGSGLIINSAGEFDDSGNPPVDNLFNDGRSTQKAGRVGFNLDLLDGRFQNTVSVHHMDLDRDLHLVSMFGPFDANYHGTRSKLDYQGSFQASDWLTVQFGGDYEGQVAEVTDNYGTDTRDSFELAGLWGQAVLTPVENLTLTAAYRHDDHSTFGGYGTYRFTGAYLLPSSGTKLHASYGTGFRAPSLYELYAPFGTGNPALLPESSTSFDIGIEQRFFDGALVGDVTYFQLDTENLIDYSYATFSYVQLPGVTKRNGVEASLRWMVNPWLDLGGAYTYTRTRQPDGLTRPRIPEHDFALTATVRPAEKWTATATAHAVFNVTDRISPSFGTFLDVPLDDYLLIDARIAYKPTEATEIYLRGENLLNQRYQLVSGYGTAGAAVYAGFKASF